MDASALIAPSDIHCLAIGNLFHKLDLQERLYAHHLSRAAWHGTRIILRQVSPESTGIFAFILELYGACSGNWHELARKSEVSSHDLHNFLEYAGTFLSNIGNYYGSGDQKFTPNVQRSVIERMSKITLHTNELFEEIADRMFMSTPSVLGFPSVHTQSSYYPGKVNLSRKEISEISRILETTRIFPENTRLTKSDETSRNYHVLVASSESSEPRSLHCGNMPDAIELRFGDHAEELEMICRELSLALPHCANEMQKQTLIKYTDSFKTGDLEHYREGLKFWVQDAIPTVENIFGFVEPYRDPFGVRAEFEGLVAINDDEETAKLKKLIDKASVFIKQLPWAVGQTENNGKGPFEKAWFDAPSLSSIHTLAYCSSIIFPGINLPNYNDIRQDVGFKNVIIENRMQAESSTSHLSPFVPEIEAETFRAHKHSAYYIWVVLHELLGHGTGKLLREESGSYNFDIKSPPINPLDNKPVTSWYAHGQSWTGQFEDLATTVDECRAELVGAYLMDDKALLEIFNFTDVSPITAGDLTYNLYLQLGVDGLRGLQNYDSVNKKWGQAHSRAHFATLKWLLRDSNDFMKIEIETTDNIRVRVDRNRIVSHGKPCIGRMLLRLHIYRCTGDVKSCREFYEDLSEVTDQAEEWRRIVLTKKEPKLKFVQANTFLNNGAVTLKEYNATNEGIVQSWAERQC